MSEALNFDQTENLVLHYLAASNERKSAREVQEALQVNMVMVTRALMNAKNRKPALIDLSDGKYAFIGSRDSLDPLPEEYREIIGVPEEAVSVSENVESSGSQDETPDPSFLGPVDQQVLELLTVKKKVPLSGIIRQFKLEDDEAGLILEDLESKDLLIKEHVEDFDEDCFSISSKGKDLIEKAFEEPAGSNVYHIKKASSKEDSKKSEKTTAAPKEAHMSGSQRKFKMPSFDNIPEENASSRGRPTGDRDYDELRVCMLGYIQENQPCAKSNVSHTLARLLTDFGRETIKEEVDSLVEHGLVQREQSGKREVFSLTDAGANIVDQVRANKPIAPIISEDAVSKPASKASKAAKAAPAASAPKPKPTAAKPAAAKPAAAKPAKPSVETPAPAATAAPAAPAPAAPAPAAPRAAEDAGLSNRINQIIQTVSGENAYELRYCFDQLLERVAHLEKSNDYLKRMNKGLIDEI